MRLDHLLGEKKTEEDKAANTQKLCVRYTEEEKLLNGGKEKLQFEGVGQLYLNFGGHFSPP